MGFNSAFKGLIIINDFTHFCHIVNSSY